MLKYDMIEQGGAKIIVVQADDLQRYALHDADGNAIQFKRNGNKAVAITSGAITVWRKPSGTAYHYEYMLHNSRSLWLGLTPDFSRLARNMYEYSATI